MELMTECLGKWPTFLEQERQSGPAQQFCHSGMSWNYYLDFLGQGLAFLVKTDQQPWDLTVRRYCATVEHWKCETNAVQHCYPSGIYSSKLNYTTVNGACVSFRFNYFYNSKYFSDANVVGHIEHNMNIWFGLCQLHWYCTVQDFEGLQFELCNRFESFGGVLSLKLTSVFVPIVRISC